MKNRCLVSKLFDVCPRSTLEEIVQQDEVRVAWGTGIAGHVAKSGEPVNIPDAYQVSSIKIAIKCMSTVFTHIWSFSQDERFNREIDLQTGYRTKALLCMPIKDSSGDVIGVAQVINKLNCERFTENDEKVCKFESDSQIHISFTFELISYFFSFLDIFIVFTILRNWPSKCTALWKISIRSKTESSSVGFGTNDLRRAKHNWAYGVANFDAYAKLNSVSTCSSKISKSGRIDGMIFIFYFHRRNDTRLFVV